MRRNELEIYGSYIYWVPGEFLHTTGKPDILQSHHTLRTIDLRHSVLGPRSKENN
jgi:hypothetical protein